MRQDGVNILNLIFGLFSNQNEVSIRFQILFARLSFWHVVSALLYTITLKIQDLQISEKCCF